MVVKETHSCLKMLSNSFFITIENNPSVLFNFRTHFTIYFGANDELVSFAAIIWVFMKKRCMTTQITAAKETNDEHVGHNSRQLAEGQEQNHPVFSVTITLFYF